MAALEPAVPAAPRPPLAGLKSPAAPPAPVELSGFGAGPSFVEAHLARYRDLAFAALLDGLPRKSPAYLYDLIPAYPRRGGKGLRAALCLATCRALGGSVERALPSAVAIELFHNAFLVHDDVQDESERRRGGPTLVAEHGPAIAVNVGNALNLLAFSRLMENRTLVGPTLTWKIVGETQEMLRHTLEGQAIELGWIRDNVCDLDQDDYYRMCLKKTSWYTCIYPCRVGALIACNGQVELDRFFRFGWYLGAAFQIQDDLLNLEGDYAAYGKEISGDLWEGKRTLMLIHALRSSRGAERRRLERFLARPRPERSRREVAWVRERIDEHGGIAFARRCAAQLAGAALREGVRALREVPDSDDLRFLLAAPRYVVSRDR